MIQRIQSLWLLLAAVFTAITFQFPFYIGDWNGDTISTSVGLNARTTTMLAVVSVFTGVLAFVNIFFFKNRKTQLRLCILGILLSLLLLTLYFLEVQNFISGGMALWCIFPFAVLAFYIMAARGISADQKLIKSMDRLR